MFNAVIVATIIAVILIAFGALCAIGDWAEKKGRAFCLFHWYNQWSLKKGKRHAALTKMKTRVEKRAADAKSAASAEK